MFEFLKSTDKKEAIPGEENSKFDVALTEVENLSLQVKDHSCVEKVPEQGNFLKLGSHKVTGKELNAVTTHIDDSIIQVKNVQIETLRHILQLYQGLDALDAEHVAGILAALKAAETATDLAHINDENIGKIISFLMQDNRVLAHKKEQDERIATLETKVKKAYLVACGAVVLVFASLVFSLIVMI